MYRVTYRESHLLAPQVNLALFSAGSGMAERAQIDQSEIEVLEFSGRSNRMLREFPQARGPIAPLLRSGPCRHQTFELPLQLGN